jgi:beta-galactosidase
LTISILFVQCRTETKKAEPTPWSSYYQVDTGIVVNVMMTAYKTTMIANGTDETPIRICLADRSGMEIRNASRSIAIYINGDAGIRRENGDALEFRFDAEGNGYYVSEIANGYEYLILTAGTSPDRIQVEVKADTLWPASHEIHTIPADVELLTPTEDQLSRSSQTIFNMLGADISFLPQFEDHGMKFYDKGEEKDAIAILADHGFNTIRLRIFVNPENEDGYAPETGYCGLEYTSKMAKRVKEAGMKLLLNFHYSDYWADPQQQNKPLAWKDLDFDSLTLALKDYSRDVILHLKNQGTMPEMVQIGNEINHGLLWPDGHISNMDNLATLLKAGVEGVREADPSIIIMMHIALGGQHDEAVFWLDNMIARGVDFDVLGLSYYPRWHGTLDDLNNNLQDLVIRYKKDVNVVEYALFIEEIHDIVFSLPENFGKGTCIWEPLSSWGGLFNRDGTALEKIYLYDTIRNAYYTD